MRYKASDIAKLGTIMGIWAHPDDEAWVAAGLMAAAVQAGQRVVCVTATMGDAGQTADEARWPQARLGAIRRQEMQDSLAVLGVSEHHWLGYRDGELAGMPSGDPVKRLVRIIDEVRPDSLVTFGADGLTGHADHITVHHWTHAARQAAGSLAQLLCAAQSAESYHRAGRELDKAFNIYYNTRQLLTVAEAEADVCFALPLQLREIKERALRAHASQMTRFFARPDYCRLMQLLMGSECFMFRA